MALFWSFSTAGGYIPLILRQKGIDTSQSLNETYVGYLEIYTPGVSCSRLPRLQRTSLTSPRTQISATILGAFVSTACNVCAIDEFAHLHLLPRSSWRFRVSAVASRWCCPPPSSVSRSSSTRPCPASTPTLVRRSSICRARLPVLILDPNRYLAARVLGAVALRCSSVRLSPASAPEEGPAAHSANHSRVRSYAATVR